MKLMTFSTTDLCLATTLVCYGYKLDSIDRTNQDKVVFRLLRDEDLDEIIQMYFSYRLTIEPLNFFNVLKNLKTRIHNF